MTAVLATTIADPSRYSYELKWDGYRIVAFKLGGAVRLVSRKGNDYTKEFPSIARDVAKLDAEEVVLDGEVCALDARGLPSFQLLQNRRRGVSLTYFVFDVLRRDGRDLRAQPIEARRAELADVIGEHDRRGSIVVSTASENDLTSVLDLACARGLEGVVAKQKGSSYIAGKRPTWLKIKCHARQELAVVGWLPLEGTRNAIGSLLLGVMEPDGRFHYAGKVGTGFDDRMRGEIARALAKTASKTPTAVGVPKLGGLVRFVEPRLVAEVRFTEWTESGHVRHPSFLGFRADKRPEECVREVPVHAAAPASTPARPKPRGPVVLGIAISNPDRVLAPTPLTKLDLARYYEAIASEMLPHVEGRPLTLLRWEEGASETEKGGVFMRHRKAWGPDALRRVSIREKTKTGEYLVADTPAALVALAQMDVLEVHTWNSRADDVEHPDRLVFDLDPAEDVPFGDVVKAAHVVRERLADLGVVSFPKTTGAKGLHVVAPLVPSADVSACLAFARAFAGLLAREDPKRFTTAMAKAARPGKIFVDYLRNNRTNTSVAAFSTRARPGAPVSVPLAWAEVDRKLRPSRFTPRVVLARVREMPDPWDAYFRTAQHLPRRA